MKKFKHFLQKLKEVLYDILAHIYNSMIYIKNKTTK